MNITLTNCVLDANEAPVGSTISVSPLQYNPNYQQTVFLYGSTEITHNGEDETGSDIQTCAGEIPLIQR